MDFNIKKLIKNKNFSFILIGLLYIFTLFFANILFKNETIHFYKWVIMLLLIGIPTLPITNSLFKTFSDKGYFFSKTLSITFSSLLFFWLSSFKILKFTTFNIISIILFLTFIVYFIVALNIKINFKNGFNLSISKKQKYNIDLTKTNLKYIFIEELVFLILFTFLMYLKAFNPSAYGTERFMDYGFMSSMMLTDYFPVEDFWFSNTNLNYYYIGQYISTFMTKISFSKVEYSYNFMLMTICAMATIQSFSIVNKLLEERLDNNKNKTKLSIIGGCIASIAVCFMGNMHYVLFKWILPFINKYYNISETFNIEIPTKETYWFPNSTRYIGYNPDLPDKTIHEFPSYSFVLGDLHAHVVNIVFVLTIVAILLAFAINSKNNKKEFFINNNKTLKALNKKIIFKELFSPTILLVAIFLGLFNGTNFWDFPIYFVVAGAIILFTNFKQWGFSFITFVFTLIQGIIILALSQLVILPFLMHFVKMASEICIAQNHTMLYQLLILWGFPISCALVGIIVSIKDNVQKNNKKIKTFIDSINIIDMLMILISCCAIGLVIVPEILYVKDIYGDVYARCNTMFKLVYQAFILFGLGIGYYIVRLFSFNTNKLRKIFGVIFLILTLACTGYFYTSCSSWFGNIFDKERYISLNALSYLETDNTFVYDKEIIKYIKENIEGMPTILEANGDSYTSYNRMSVATGKPTVLGAISGAVAGLVAITPAAGFVDVSGALIIGAVAPFVSYFAIYMLKAKMGYDDALDVWGIHGMSGIWGAIATGIFAVPAIGGTAGLLYGNPGQVLIQVISVIATMIYAFTISFVLAKILDKAMGGIRVEESEEIGGLDTNLHEESAYNLN